MDVEELKEDVRQGRIDTDRLVDLIVKLQRELQQAKQRIDELEQQLGGSSTAKVDEPFSVDAEEKRQEARGKKRRERKKSKRRGRKTTAEKLESAERTEEVFPDGVPKEDCWLSHTRPVWRLEGGRTVLVAYQVYRKGNQYGRIPGVIGRSEFGLEITVSVGYLVYILGLSLDKACALIRFFLGLQVQKSQVDAMLNQLARHWEKEFDILCTLLANSAVVHADETGWSINSVWAFLSEKARVLFFGVNKDAQTLEHILDPATFLGIVISDNAAVYANFTHAQKCWAHLLRKAIKLTLQEPENEVYRHLADRLLEIYRAACRLQRDQRYGDEGRRRRIGELDDEILDLVGWMWAKQLGPLEGPGPVDDYRRLANELMDLMLKQQLFKFVTAATVETPAGETQPVSGTNNEAERTLRSPAQSRDTGRTNKTLHGSRRQTVIVSVLESLRQYLSTFTLSTVVDEVRRWSQAGRSCFAKLLEKLKLSPPSTSPLDLVLPKPDG